LEIVFEHSGTADSTDAASGGTEAPTKKTKITFTEQEENFGKKFRPGVSKIEIEVIKTEVIKYQTLTGSIKSFEESKDIKGKDTFDLSDWWKSNCATLSGFAYVFRAVLTNTPNSCPSESLFTLFNTTYNDDQKSSYTDYIELSM